MKNIINKIIKAIERAFAGPSLGCFEQSEF